MTCFGTCSRCREWVSVRDLRNARPGSRRTRTERDMRELCGVGCAIVGRRRKLYDSIISGRSDANIPFEQTVNMLKYLGFDERTKGSHHTFTREGIEEIINLQDVGGECKPYQVKQVRNVLKKYNLRKEL